MFFSGWFRFLLLFLILVVFVCTVIIFTGLETRKQKDASYIASLSIASVALLIYIIMFIIDLVMENNRDTRTEREKLRAQNRAVINSPVRNINIDKYGNKRN
jgi:undecaprenyl pyrophosphate phosphatase UppP